MLRVTAFNPAAKYYNLIPSATNNFGVTMRFDNVNARTFLCHRTREPLEVAYPLGCTEDEDAIRAWLKPLHGLSMKELCQQQPNLCLA